MGVTAGTVETYANTLIFEDLENAYTMISPEECPFQMAVGKGSVPSIHHEWPVVDLLAADPTNRVMEGEDTPPTDNPTLGRRLGNYTQISDKKIIVSRSSEVADAAAENIQKIAKQMALKLRELKRDIEVMMQGNYPSITGPSGTARQSAGFMGYVRTNTSFGATGADPTLSGTTTGYPLAAAVNGTVRALTEDMFNDTIQKCWIAGGDPSLAIVNANNKRIISQTFNGVSTMYKDATDKRAINAIDFYESDFGQITIVPSRFLYSQENTTAGTHFAILLIDPDFVSIKDYDPVNEKPLAETGHSIKRLLWREYMLQVDNEAAHGIIRDLNGVIPALP